MPLAALGAVGEVDALPARGESLAVMGQVPANGEGIDRGVAALGGSVPEVGAPLGLVIGWQVESFFGSWDTTPRVGKG